MTSDNRVLKSILELRESEFSDIPKDLVEEIVNAESNHIDDRAKAASLVRQIIQDWVGNH